jgi:hypothetical protein
LSQSSAPYGSGSPVAEWSGRRLPLSTVRASARRERLVGVAALGGVFGIAAAMYWWTSAPLYNPTGSIDPWLYTALFVNFEEIYKHFGGSYYASRLPWIVPGRITYSVLPVDAAYWVLHGLAFSGGVVALFVLVRRYLGLVAAIVGAATLALTPMYWNAHYWDYVDGVMMTYLLGGLCFGLPLATGRRRAASLAAAGVFFAAAVTTNLLAAVVAVIYPIAYIFVQPAAGLRQRLVTALKDLASLCVGAAALLVTLGFYARSNGGEFLYFKTQIDIVRSGIVGTSKVPGYEWLRTEPRLLVPIFLVAVAAPLLVLGRRLPPFRFAAGTVAGLAVLTVFIYGWEFFAGGSVLDYTYSSSYFAIPIALAMASVAALILSLARARRPVQLGVVAASIGAAAAALGVIYGGERVEWTGKTGARISVAIMALAALLTLAALATRRSGVAPFAAVAAIGLVAFASHFAIDSSTGTFNMGATAPVNHGLYHAALDQVSFVNRSRKRGDPPPAFWYRSAGRPELISIQSMYYYGYTAIAEELPSVTKAMRERLPFWNPQTMVMFCDTRDCGGAQAALRRAGFPYSEENAARISRGPIRFWAIFLRAAPRQ